MSVHLSIWTNSSPSGQIYMKFYIWFFFKNVENAGLIQIWQEWQVLHTKTDTHFFMYLAEFFVEWEVSDKSCGENQNTHFMLCHFFNCTVYEIMWKNNVEVARPQMTIWHMHIACCLTKATDIHSEYVILIAFPLQQWLHECTSMFNVILYIYCLSHNLYGFSA